MEESIMATNTVVDDEYHLKLDPSKISYLDTRIINEYSRLKLTSFTDKSYVFINPLCLAALCPNFAQIEAYEYEAIEDLNIITEYSYTELEQLVKFCHFGEYPCQLPIPTPNIFHDIGINFEELAYPRVKVKKEKVENVEGHEVKPDWPLHMDEPEYGGLDYAEDDDDIDEEEEDEDFEPKVKPKKRGRPKSTSESKPKKKRVEASDDDDDDWEPGWQEVKTEKSDDVYEEKLERKGGRGIKGKAGRKRKDCSDLIAAEQVNHADDADQYGNFYVKLISWFDLANVQKFFKLIHDATYA